MAAAFPGQYNTFIPNMDATNNMVVDFSRNPKKFALPKWAQYTPVKKNLFYYLLMTVEMAGRVLNADGADLYWPDNADRPSGAGNTESFEFIPSKTKRYNSGFQIGDLTAEQADWQILAQHARIHAQRMMTFRSLRAVTNAVTAGNYAAANTAAVSAISGVTGKHDLSTTARKDIKRSLDYAADVIRKATLGAVMPEDLIFVCSPGYARKISVSQEIVDHIKGSPAAKEELTTGLGPNSQYGLPSQLYSYNIVVEDTVRVTSRKGAPKVADYILPDATPFMCSRPGGLEGIEGAPSFSTHTIFLKEEMTVEEKHDTDNRNHKGSITDDFASVVTAPISGFLFTAAVN